MYGNKDQNCLSNLETLHGNEKGGIVARQPVRRQHHHRQGGIAVGRCRLAILCQRGKWRSQRPSIFSWRVWWWREGREP